MELHAEAVQVRIAPEDRLHAEALRAFTEGVRGYALVLLDPSGRVQEWNAGAERVFGFADRAVVGTSAAIFFTHRDAAGGALERLLRTARELGRAEDEGWRVRGDGSWFWAFNLVLPLRGPDGKTLGFAWISRDLSHRKQIEDAFNVSGSLDFDEVLHRLGNVIAPHLADACIVHITSPQERVFTVTDPVEPLAPHADLEAAHHGVIEPLLRSHRGDPHLMEQELRGATSMEGAARRHALLRGLGVTSWLAVPLRANANVSGWIVLFAGREGRRLCTPDLSLAIDLSRRVSSALANAVLHSELLRQKRLREEMLAIVSHDLKSPLAGIQLQATRLLRGFHARGEDAVRRAASEIGTTARRMESLILDLLDLGRVEGGHLLLRREHVPAGRLLELCAEESALLAAQHGVRLDVDAPETLAVIGDADRLVQVIGNLLINAIKFSPRGSAVRMRAARDQAAVVFTIEDDGPGIPADVVARLFRPFWQQRSTDRRSSGLGLYIARRLVEAHGGEIWVESRPGRGTRVSFTICAA